MKTKEFIVFIIALVAFSGCRYLEPSHDMSPGGHTGENKTRDDHSKGHESAENHSGASENHGDAAHSLSEVERPQRIKDMMASRGEQDAANPTLKFVEPANDSIVNSSTVKVKLELGGDLKGYKPMKDPQTQMGNHIHIILDNQPYEAHYNLEGGFELRNVADGEHTLRVFPSRPWHESYKNNGAFQMVKFIVKSGGADATKPATTNSGQQMSNVNANAHAPAEGKDMAQSTAGVVDASKPLLTYSRPKGEYKGADAEAIMIDFWLTNAKLAGDGGEYHARYSIDGNEAKMIDKWQPIWLSGLSDGKHSVKLELVDKNETLVDNGGYNSTTREITVAR
jgi:hypothetical protein